MLTSSTAGSRYLNSFRMLRWSSKRGLTEFLPFIHNKIYYLVTLIFVCLAQPGKDFFVEKLPYATKIVFVEDDIKITTEESREYRMPSREALIAYKQCYQEYVKVAPPSKTSKCFSIIHKLSTILATCPLYTVDGKIPSTMPCSVSFPGLDRFDDLRTSISEEIVG